MQNALIAEIRKELQKHIEPLYKEQNGKFFKEQVKMFGVRTPLVRDIAARYFLKVRRIRKKELFSLCSQLLRSGQSEEITVALDWAWRARSHYDANDFELFESWLNKYISNWASCDDFCAHALGFFLAEFPEILPKARLWARSQNQWLRRAAAVSLIYAVRKQKYLKDIFEVSDILLKDPEDLVQKGYGWALKEASNVYPREVFHYVMKRKKEMPRTALRYAVEKLPPRLRREAMQK